MSIRLVVADPHPIYLLGMEALLGGESDLELLCLCDTAKGVQEAVHLHNPDLLITDIAFRDRRGLEMIGELRREAPAVRVVILTGGLDDEQTIETLRLGVQGVLLKSMPSRMLVQCIHNVHAGGHWMEKQSLGQAFEKMLRREAGARRIATILTPRETEIMCLVAKGLNNRQIAAQLSVGEGTVKVHVHNIYTKIGVNNRVDLTLYAQKKGLL